jgi:dolichol kinase
MAEGQPDDAGHSTLNTVSYMIFLSTIVILTLSIGQLRRDVTKFTTRCLQRVENIDLPNNSTISVNNNDNLSIPFISELLRHF